jgi:hypothetical protein
MAKMQTLCNVCILRSKHLPFAHRKSIKYSSGEYNTNISFVVIFATLIC